MHTKKILVKTIAIECQQCLASGDEGILRLAQTKKLSKKPVTENQFSWIISCSSWKLSDVESESCSVMSDSLWPHELQHARPLCPSPTPGVHPNYCPSSWWCHPAISSSDVPFSSCPQSLPVSEFFCNDSTLHMRWPKYWSFSFSFGPSKKHPGLISFRMDWLVSLCPRDSQGSSPTPQFKSIDFLTLSFLHSPTFTSIHDHWEKHSLD